MKRVRCLTGALGLVPAVFMAMAPALAAHSHLQRGERTSDWGSPTHHQSKDTVALAELRRMEITA
jgi:hypothetical protein